MSASDYDVFEDPYCYKGTFVIKNKAGLRDAARLEAFEPEISNVQGSSISIRLHNRGVVVSG